MNSSKSNQGKREKEVKRNTFGVCKFKSFLVYIEIPQLYQPNDKPF